jgi:hypothetical protein
METDGGVYSHAKDHACPGTPTIPTDVSHDKNRFFKNFALPCSLNSKRCQILEERHEEDAGNTSHRRIGGSGLWSRLLEGQNAVAHGAAATAEATTIETTPAATATTTETTTEKHHPTDN